jgi:hypothetical protein
MRVDVAWWDLDGTGQTIDSLRAHVGDEQTREWSGVPGLLLKLWLADPVGNRWGAVMIWQADRPADDLLPANRAAALIGGPPTHRVRFETQAVSEGLASPGLSLSQQLSMP